ncbi:hypothetical protein GC170_14820 [bacterium]|nr:hypothetical protein [bacterium]
MGFALNCTCGRSFDVQAGQAGSTLKCQCGAEVQVPSVSKLREMAGKAAYEVGVIDQINGMIDRGELPAGGVCAVSGSKTEDVMEILVKTEKFQGARDFRAYAILGLLFSPIVFLLSPSMMVSRAQHPEGSGRDTWVRTPLFVDSKYQQKVRRASQKKLKRWLRSVPVYAKLLDEYPQATVEFESGS